MLLHAVGGGGMAGEEGLFSMPGSGFNYTNTNTHTHTGTCRSAN